MSLLGVYLGSGSSLMTAVLSVVKRVFIFRISELQHLQDLENLKLLQNIQLLFTVVPKS